MKLKSIYKFTIGSLVLTVLLTFITVSSQSLCAAAAADDAALIAAVKAASDERASATTAADRKRLDAIFSDELRYTHSTGTVDTKKSYMESIVSGKTKYHSIEFESRNFSFPAPDIALEAGRAHMKTSSATGETDAVFSFLAVWRKEKGQWRFLAWQSSKLVPPAAAAK